MLPFYISAIRAMYWDGTELAEHMPIFADLILKIEFFFVYHFESCEVKD